MPLAIQIDTSYNHSSHSPFASKGVKCREMLSAPSSSCSSAAMGTASEVTEGGTDLNGELRRDVDDHCNARIFSMVGPPKPDTDSSILSYKLQLANNSVSQLQNSVLESQRCITALHHRIDHLEFQLRLLTDKFSKAKNEASQNAAATKRYVAISEELRQECEKLHHEREALERRIMEAEEQKDLAEVRAVEAETRYAEAEERRALSLARASKAEKRLAEVENLRYSAEKRAKEAEKREKALLRRVEENVLGSPKNNSDLRKRNGYLEEVLPLGISNQVAVSSESKLVSQRHSKKRPASNLTAVDSNVTSPENQVDKLTSQQGAPQENAKPMKSHYQRRLNVEEENVVSSNDVSCMHDVQIHPEENEVRNTPEKNLTELQEVGT